MQTETTFEKHVKLGISTLNYDAHNIEAATIEGLLIPICQIIKKELEAIAVHVNAHKNVNDTISELNKVRTEAERLLSHFEFTIAVLASKSDEELAAIKEKHHTIRDLYSKIVSKDCFAIVPLKHVVVTFHDKIILEMFKVFKKCFKVKRNGQGKFTFDSDNHSRLKIVLRRLELAVEHYPQVASFEKEDLFYQARSTSTWQELQKSAIIRKILTEEEAYVSFQEFEHTNNLGHIIIKNVNQHGLLNFKGAFNFVKDMVSIGSRARIAETHALLRLVNPTIDEAFQLWNLPEHPFVSAFLALGLPILGYDDLIHVPRLFPRITKEVIFEEYSKGTINKICPMAKTEIEAPILPGTREEIVEELFAPSESKIPIRILSDERLNLKESSTSMFKGMVRKVTRVITGAEFSEAQEEGHDGLEESIVIHIHGGGFVAMSSASHRCYLNRWVKNTKVIHFSIDYRLAPKDPYPAGLDDVWQGYLWIMNYAENILGIKTKRVLLVGDSAGANLALALSLRLIRAGLQPPTGLLLFYPALTIDPHTSSPSTFQAISDVVMSPSILKLCVQAYLGDNGYKYKEDPFICPLLASDELLEKLPPTRVVVGSKDPFHDDSWRLLSKLRGLNKDAKLIVHEHIKHGYLNHPDLKNYHLYIDDACETIKELLTPSIPE